MIQHESEAVYNIRVFSCFSQTVTVTLSGIFDPPLSVCSHELLSTDWSLLLFGTADVHLTVQIEIHLLDALWDMRERNYKRLIVELLSWRGNQFLYTSVLMAQCLTVVLFLSCRWWHSFTLCCSVRSSTSPQRWWFVPSTLFLIGSTSLRNGKKEWRMMRV